MGTSQDLARQYLLKGNLLEGLHGVDLVLHLIVEVRGHGRGVHDADVDALAL